ncbi:MULTISPECIES: MarR family winged helix-turn-helix transcriptional regulator [unclassified Streptomyces]|uniref:MarR family winged helix-turn-helix transcriptional regulator n=1 Tax=unclassified Streptomyces TaxID=2593676 RepID=UPI00224FDD89|nr:MULTISPECIES: MarR family transcriptional regulator [unclassified Streptomyces]MCX4641979.1 MarR family transcriptional regulator [Streptomyces sp. NBC_01446]MCX5085711.1 MarR family transcriptional regulator [Streptomyces sp. NBC_00401]MCX5326852.1 MarR family transcriptional regulator [Streptomyces sp. NBC_00120]
MNTDEPRWLDDEEQQTWLAMVSMLVRFPAALDAQLQRDANISHFEYQVLAGLSMAPECTLRMSDLADFAEASLSRLSHTAKRLEGKGWITRTPDPTDGRFTLATLTDAGLDKVTATAPGHVAEVRRLLIDSLTKAQSKQLREISRRVNDAMGPRPDYPSVRTA